MTKLTIKEVARRLDVSTATISNAFNRPDQLSEKKRKEILEACEKMGYFGPNKAARFLRKGQSNIIALILPDSLDYMVSDPVASQMIQGVAKTLKQSDTNLLLFSGSNSSVNEVVDFVDGFICYGLPRNASLLDHLTQLTKRVVTVDFELPSLPYVNIDNHDAAYQSAKIALADNVKSPAILGLRLIDNPETKPVFDEPLEGSETSISNRRLEGYRQALTEQNLEVGNDRIWHIPESSNEFAREAAKQALSASPRPDALLCMSDVIALTAMQEVLRLGLRIPEDIRIVGFDGIEEGMRYHPTLATVQQFSENKGEVAAKLFFDQSAASITLPFEIVNGESAPTP